MQYDVTVSCPVYDSFRVQQIAGMFDVPLEQRSTERFQVELPDETEDWSIGLIVGPSGSGKSTIARQAYGSKLYQAQEWPTDQAVVDTFGELSAREVTDLLVAVGFGSPPSWVKPYSALSNGEQFRCDLAKALALGNKQAESNEKPSIVAFDEFTSVVDRNVAKVCSAAIARGIRSDKIRSRFVGISCHYDIAEWLEPDWVLDMATGQLQRRRLRRPRIELEIHRCSLEAWRMFARHHYLTGQIAPQARGYLATWNGEPVSFTATLPLITRKGCRRFSRLVTLPDYQGIGISMQFLEAVAQIHVDMGHKVSATSSHPALVGHWKRSPRWRARSFKKTGQASRRGQTSFRGYKSSTGRAVVSFEYLSEHEHEPIDR